MATYQRPGVFVTESLQPIANPIGSDSDSVAAFVGVSSGGGPIGPTLVNSWNQYQSLYGNLKQVKTDLAYAVYSFFNNGGAQCYVCRVVASDASDSTKGTPATLVLKDAGTLTGEAGVPKSVLDVSALSPGTWASSATSNTQITLTITTETDGGFDLSVDVGAGTVAHESFTDLSLDPNSDRNALTIINSETVGSNYISVALDPSMSGNKVFGTDYGNPAPLTASPLTGGTDGVVTNADYIDATELLGVLNQVMVVNLPAFGDTATLSTVANWCQTVGDKFLVVDGVKPGPTDTAATVASSLQTLASGLPAISQVAVYGPWLYVQDPASTAPGAVRLTAPGGSVLGQYMRSDALRGVQKVPAGTGTSLSGVVQTYCAFLNTTLDTLNSANINVIRTVPGAGFCIMGGRTLKVGYPDRYVNIRRGLIYVERNLLDMTQFAIFEDNNPDLWQQISDLINQWLLVQFQLGLLSGDQPSDAYFVICDATNNTQASINAGVVNVQVGVALNAPAEFIIINIGQFEGGTTVVES